MFGYDRGTLFDECLFNMNQNIATRNKSEAIVDAVLGMEKECELKRRIQQKRFSRTKIQHLQ